MRIKGLWRIRELIRMPGPKNQVAVDWLIRHLSFDIVSMARVYGRTGLVRIGSDYGGWIVPESLLEKDSICYCAGVGEDVSFDLGLISRFGCKVYAFDPTPRAKLHIDKCENLPAQFHFSAIGLWDKSKTVKFYAPKNPEHVSHSILNLQKTEKYFEASCKRLSEIMSENNHDKLDLLKIDIEGAEYNVLDSIIEDKLNIGIICVEYDEANNPLDGDYMRRIRSSIGRLREHGYRIVAIRAKCNYTLVKED